jgi:hypothetical protein
VKNGTAPIAGAALEDDDPGNNLVIGGLPGFFALTTAILSLKKEKPPVYAHCCKGTGVN